MWTGQANLLFRNTPHCACLLSVRRGLNFIAAWRRIENTAVWLFCAQHRLKGECFVSEIIYITSTDEGSAQGGGCGDVMLLFHLCNRMGELELYVRWPARPLLLQTQISHFLTTQNEELAIAGQYIFMVFFKNKPNTLPWCHTFFYMFQFVLNHFQGSIRSVECLHSYNILHIESSRDAGSIITIWEHVLMFVYKTKHYLRNICNYLETTHCTNQAWLCT